MAELVDALVSGTSGSNTVQVQVLFRAPSVFWRDNKGGFMIKLSSGKEFQIDIEPAKAAFLKVKEMEMSGWLDVERLSEQILEVSAAAEKIRSDSDFLVCIGIGGSYLGHKAVIDALPAVSRTKVLYAGNSLSSFAIKELVAEIGDHDFSINVISKSGTTTEPAVAFRIFKKMLIGKYGFEEACKRIYATTDAEKGALHDEAVKNGYTRFVVPDDIGGRYSVLTPVGLLPIAAAGIDIQALLKGAGEAAEGESLQAALSYATLRAELAARGFDTEVLASFVPRLQTFSEWWKQLFGESEGKEKQGIFPASVTYTTDLHSLGQYMQEGRRNIFETVLCLPDNDEMVIVAGLGREVLVPKMDADVDGLKYLEGKSLEYINEKAREATIEAHRAGGIPVFEIWAGGGSTGDADAASGATGGLSAETLGELIYFFEVACAVSAVMQGVNPFDQPGVESYKNNMFRLLGKPGCSA